MSLTTTVNVKRYNGHHFNPQQDLVVREVPFTIFVNDEELVTLVCSPGSLEELAAGFLCSEGILRRPEDLKGITVNKNDGLIWVETTSPAPATGNFLKRYITTCCGKGRASFYFVNDASGIVPVEGELELSADDLTALSGILEERAQLFRQTGGAHGAALCTTKKVMAMYEDIGRHNAVDKILGHCFLKKIPLSDKVLAISGRVSSEILIKVARMGISVLISRSAPTDLALRMAEDLGVTVAGFVREKRLNLYTHPERIRGQNTGDRRQETEHGY